MQKSLPRWEKGSEIKAAQLNQLAEAIERVFGLEVDGSSGLEISDSLVGRLIGAVPQRVSSYAKVVNGVISAANGTTLGYGLIDLYYKDDQGVLQPYGGPPEGCYNIVTSPVPGGKFITVLWVDDDWSVVVEDCAQ